MQHGMIYISLIVRQISVIFTQKNHICKRENPKQNPKQQKKSQSLRRRSLMKSAYIICYVSHIINRSPNERKIVMDFYFHTNVIFTQPHQHYYSTTVRDHLPSITNIMTYCNRIHNMLN